MSRPGATYRLQFRPHLDFRQAAALADYLRELGVTHLHASPVLKATPGSDHGYDVVDPRLPDPELGGAEGYRELCFALERVGLGQILDIVPNHMATAGPENPWWWDVLANGPWSAYARYFDVEWGTGEPVLVPVLDDHYGRVLEDGRIRLVREGPDVMVRFADHRFPVSSESLGDLLADAAGELTDGRSRARLAFLADAFRYLSRSPREVGRAEAAVEGGEGAGGRRPGPGARRVGPTDRRAGPRDRRAGPRDRRERGRDGRPGPHERPWDHREVLHQSLVALLEEEPEAAGAVDRVVSRWNAPDPLDAFLSLQHYRLAHWRLADAELGYRRFFHINELVALRSEDEAVFRDTHARVLEWLRDGTLDGVRVDHPDGLRDPEAYFRRLRWEAPAAWVVGEKILEPGERLGTSWKMQGTTGYDFLHYAGGLFVDPEGEEPLTRLYQEVVDGDVRVGGKAYRTAVHDAKLEAAHRLLGSDLNRLTDLFRDVCRGHRRHRDHRRQELRDALAEVAACLPVYRTYVRADAGDAGPADQEAVDEAVAAAARRRPDLDPDPLRFLRAILLLRVAGPLEGELAMRFQQFTGPLMAKGVEDTALYRYNRLVSLNEVGSDPSTFGVPPNAFHAWAQRIQREWPETLLTTSTHDTKRSEDVRARLHVLSEIPEAWGAAVRRWRERAAPHRRAPGLPDADTEYLLYQTLVGAWPLSEERVVGFLEKAAREASVHTTWTDPDPEYEEALAAFARGVLSDEGFVADLEGFLEQVIPAGRVNSLAQTLLRLTAPGVPDLYQGCELWDLSLVDPDNRRPVDFDLRRRLLDELAGAAVAGPSGSTGGSPAETHLTPEEILARSDDGLPKLHLLRQGLALRRERPTLFGRGASYRPLEARGARAAHVVALARGDAQGEGVMAVAPRLVLGVGGSWDGRGGWSGDWAHTELDLPGGSWENRLTGEHVDGGGGVLMDELLARFPVALLARA